MSRAKQNATETTYKVGYKRPPEHSRFKPGQSGNPKGRPAGRATAKDAIERVINKKVSVREGEKTRDITILEAMLHAQATKGAKGDARSAGLLFGLLPKAGLLGEQDGNSLTTGGDHCGGGDAFERIPAQVTQADLLLEGIDETLLTREEVIELSRLCEVIDSSGGMTSLSLPQFARVQQLVNKAKGKVIDSSPNQ